MLAFELSQEWAYVIGLAFTTLGTIVVAWFQAKGRGREAKMLEAVVLGVERGVEPEAIDGLVGMKAMIRRTAEELGVEESLHKRVKELTE